MCPVTCDPKPQTPTLLELTFKKSFKFWALFFIFQMLFQIKWPREPEPNRKTRKTLGVVGK